jgi:predicted nucleic acid-binding protein
VLRKRWLAGDLTDRRFKAAIGDLEDLELQRYPTLALTARASELRANVTAYDGAYVALAERVRCALVTADERLSKAPGIRCPVEVLRA